jgi:AraC-like DNA-binding protein
MTVWIDGVAHGATENTVCILFPGHEERFAFATGCETHHSWLHAYIPHLPEELVQRFRRLAWPLHLSSSMAQLMHDALTTQSAPFSTTPVLLKALAVQMLWRYLGEGERRLDAAQTHPVIEQTCSFIRAHLGEPLTLDLIAQQAAVSPSYLMRLFREQLHTSPMAYLWQSRVTCGVEMLEQTGLPIGVIAQQCGFQTRYHFSRRIHLATGYGPSELRRRAWRG